MRVRKPGGEEKMGNVQKPSEPRGRKKWISSGTPAFLARFILGSVFIYAAIDKIAHPQAFSEAVYKYQILPEFLLNLTAIILPWLELCIALFLILGIWLPGTVFLSNFLLVCFFLCVGVQHGTKPGYSLWLFQCERGRLKSCSNGVVCHEGQPVPVTGVLPVLQHLWFL